MGPVMSMYARLMQPLNVGRSFLSHLAEGSKKRVGLERKSLDSLDSWDSQLGPFNKLLGQLGWSCMAAG